MPAHAGRDNLDFVYYTCRGGAGLPLHRSAPTAELEKGPERLVASRRFNCIASGLAEDIRTIELNSKILMKGNALANIEYFTTLQNESRRR